MAPAAREVGAGEELLLELQQLHTVKIVGGWALVTSTARQLTDAYIGYKKQSEVTGVLLSGWEGLAAACRSLVLPALRTPLVRTPLRVADVITSTGALLVQRAMPQIRSKDQLDMGLLWQVLMLPMTLSVAMAHHVLESITALLVAVFPRLQKTSAGFEKLSLLSQCLTLWVMVVLLVPAQMLQPPLFKVMDYTQHLLKSAVAVSWTWVTGLISPVVTTSLDFLMHLMAFSGNVLALARQLLGEATALVYKYATRFLGPVPTSSLGWVTAFREIVIHALSMALAAAETTYYIIFEVSGARGWFLRRISTVTPTAADPSSPAPAPANPVAGLAGRDLGACGDGDERHPPPPLAAW